MASSHFRWIANASQRTVRQRCTGLAWVWVRAVKRAAKEIEIEKKIIKIQYIICLALTMSDFGWGSRKFICHTHAHTHPLTHSLSQVAIYLQNWIKKTRNLLNLIFFPSFSFNLILFFVLMSGWGFNRWWCWFKAIYSNVRRNTVSGGTYMFMYVCMYRMWCSIIDYTFVLWSRLVSSRSVVSNLFPLHLYVVDAIGHQSHGYSIA